MTDLKPGDTVTVTFQDEDHPGIIENIHHGWIDNVRIRSAIVRRDNPAAIIAARHCVSVDDEIIAEVCGPGRAAARTTGNGAVTNAPQSGGAQRRRQTRDQVSESASVRPRQEAPISRYSGGRRPAAATRAGRGDLGLVPKHQILGPESHAALDLVEVAHVDCGLPR
jgi:hypothetical protein